MLELVVKLVLVSGLMVAVILGLRRAAKQGMVGRGGPAMRIVGRVGLTRNALVAVVMVDDRRFLVGAADQGVQLLAELDRDGVATPVTSTSTTTSDDDMAVVLDLDAVTDVVTDGPLLVTSAAAHGTGSAEHGPRIGPLDRLREMTVRSHMREPIRAHRDLRG